LRSLRSFSLRIGPGLDTAAGFVCNLGGGLVEITDLSRAMVLSWNWSRIGVVRMSCCFRSFSVLGTGDIGSPPDDIHPSATPSRHKFQKTDTHTPRRSKILFTYNRDYTTTVQVLAARRQNVPPPKYLLANRNSRSHYTIDPFTLSHQILTPPHLTATSSHINKLT
jgi:hypothetical protein